LPPGPGAGEFFRLGDLILCPLRELVYDGDAKLIAADEFGG
jgi:hypothetical protein